MELPMSPNGIKSPSIIPAPRRTTTRSFCLSLQHAVLSCELQAKSQLLLYIFQLQ